MGEARREGRELKTIEELEAFFRDLTAAERDREHSFDGVGFIVSLKVPSPSLLAVVALGLNYVFLRALTDLFRRFLPGPHVIVRLPQPLRANMFLRSRRGAEREGFNDRFQLEATDEATARDYLRGRLGDALLRLGRTYGVEMNDEEITFGPLRGRAGEEARGLADLVAALPRPPADAPAVPAFEEVVGAEGAFVEVATAMGAVRADVLRTALEGSGIPCRLLGRGQGGIFGGTDGFVVKLVVPRSYAERATEVLAAVDEAEVEGADGERGLDEGADDDEEGAAGGADEGDGEPDTGDRGAGG